MKMKTIGKVTHYPVRLITRADIPKRKRVPVCKRPPVTKVNTAFGQFWQKFWLDKNI